MEKISWKKQLSAFKDTKTVKPARHQIFMENQKS